MPYNFKASDFERIKHLYDSGISVIELSEVFGVSLQQMTDAIKQCTTMRRKGMSGFKKRTISDEMVKRALSDFKAGYPISTIAKRCGVSNATLKRYFEEFE